MAVSEGPWAAALRAKRVQWERDVPLDDIISIIDAEGLLGQYYYEGIKGKENMIDKRRTLVDYFLTKDEWCIERLDAIVQAQGGFEHLKLDAPPTPALSHQMDRKHVEETDSHDSLLAITPFSISNFLEKHEKEFFEVVNPRQSLRKLIRKGVVTEDLMKSVEHSNIDDGREILFEHLKRHASVQTLREYCKVAIDANGYPNMQSFGRKMMEELKQRGPAGRRTN